jgi:predicted nucleic acid-binding protein
MKIIIDTNIIFSAILSSDGKIGQILLAGRKKLSFYAPNLAKTEIQRHKSKLIALAEIDENTFEQIKEEVFECISFISEEQIPFEYWHNAIPLVRETDMDDIAFVVLSNYLDAILWTGDKKLIKGLSDMGFEKSVDTDYVLRLLEKTNNENT